MKSSLDIVILGLSITSSWGNGHATTYRGLVGELARRDHRVMFLERDVPWYATQRDMPHPPFCDTRLYSSLEELRDRFTETIRSADLVILGSYVPEGIAVGKWAIENARRVLAFYDIDTPVTLSRLQRNACEYLSPEMVCRFSVYLSFAGGPVLRHLEKAYDSPMARPFYCSVDPELYFPEAIESDFDLAYMGTFSHDRQPPLDNLLLEPARKWPEGRFKVAGPQYPDTIHWPANVSRVEHLPPAQHRGFYNRQRFTLNITRADMVRTGYSPSVRLFEAAACGTPAISDAWVGLDEFFEPGREILVSRSAAETLRYLRELPPDAVHEIGRRARAKILGAHTAAHRAIELENLVLEIWQRRRRRASDGSAKRVSESSEHVAERKHDEEDSSEQLPKPPVQLGKRDRQPGAVVSQPPSS